MIKEVAIIENQGAMDDLIAKVHGEAFTKLPKDLYIPPQAMEVILEAFEGPLDLLLYLIKKQNLDILDIPIAKITLQYMQYVELMRHVALELAAEYLVMAAMLAEIKSRMLLPRPIDENTEEEDPRAELVRRLQEYERFKQAAINLDQLARVERDFLSVNAQAIDTESHSKSWPQIDLKELLLALSKVYERAKMNAHHHIKKETISTRERMSQVLEKVKADHFSEFSSLFDADEGRAGVVVTFLAILELLRLAMIEMVQAKPFSPIHVKAIAH